MGYQSDFKSKLVWLWIYQEFDQTNDGIVQYSNNGDNISRRWVFEISFRFSRKGVWKFSNELDYFSYRFQWLHCPVNFILFVSKIRIIFFLNHEIRTRLVESFMFSDVDIIVYTMYNRKARKMVLNMKASDFDTDGFYSPGGGEQLCLLGLQWIYPKVLRVVA